MIALFCRLIIESEGAMNCAATMIWWSEPFGMASVSALLTDSEAGCKGLKPLVYRGGLGRLPATG